MKQKQMYQPTMSLFTREEMLAFNKGHLLYSYFIWATSRENLSSVVSDQVRLKPACPASEAT